MVTKMLHVYISVTVPDRPIHTIISCLVVRPIPHVGLQCDQGVDPVGGDNENQHLLHEFFYSNSALLLCVRIKPCNYNIIDYEL